MRAFGRPSPAAALEPPLRPAAEPASAWYRAEGGSTGWALVRAATVTGVGHRLSSEANQDCYAWAAAGSRLAIAVADGLGSVPGSGAVARVGAVSGVEAAVEDAGRSLADAAEAAIDGARDSLRGEDGTTGATTLVVAVIDEGGEVALARVGDSTAFVVSAATGEHPRWRELFDPPADHEEVPVVTSALHAGPSRSEDPPPALEPARATLAKGQVLAVLSDGMAGPWRDGPSTVAPALVEGLNSHPSVLELAGLADFSRQGCHDDRTIVVAWFVEL